ncbi:hypothetical protein D2E25_1012 [Bifidobacterium goeldii]|uniref:Uncharacterized protein n=1 Tax=Bifidobacterium goeldii TaxID=2306975 RepID=A0A430FLB6_9BIFI|nr:hypothetical protein [Bifidobacterium goeldii]RSX53689.1 hypothetical protein D2E25_1012 [Bifidobacterium goeldii]
MIIIAVVAVALIIAGIAFGISRSRSAQTPAEKPTASEQQKTQQKTEKETEKDSASKESEKSEEQPTDNQQETQQEQPAATDIPTALQQADSVCNPHTTFNAENPAQESLIVDQATKSLTLMSGSQSDFKTFNCVAQQLQIPADVTAEIDSKQDQPMQKSFTWNGLTGTWSYNVNSGLQLYIVGQ